MIISCAEISWSILQYKIAFAKIAFYCNSSFKKATARGCYQAACFPILYVYISNGKQSGQIKLHRIEKENVVSKTYMRLN